MANDPAQARAAASRVAKSLLDKGRADEAVAMLAAWAANGPNDVEGQNLLAEALRIDPAARIASLRSSAWKGFRATRVSWTRPSVGGPSRPSSASSAR